MSWWYARGRARISAREPEAWGSCDRCGFAYSLRQLTYQFQYAGQKLINTRLRVCSTCLDVPTWRANPYALPPDPVAVPDPRIEPIAAESIGGPIYWENGVMAQLENGIPMILEEI